jgi:hypothetical protein
MAAAPNKPEMIIDLIEQKFYNYKHVLFQFGRLDNPTSGTRLPSAHLPAHKIDFEPSIKSSKGTKKQSRQ